MSNPTVAQQISLDILKDSSNALHNKQLDLLELKDRHFTQLHPLANVIALSERRRVCDIRKETLRLATKSIYFSGIHEKCEQERSDDWDLVYHNIIKSCRGSYIISQFAEPVYQREIKIELNIGCKMVGGSTRSFFTSKSRISASVKSLPLIARMIEKYGHNNTWIDHFLSTKTKKCSPLEPGYLNLDGNVEIYLENWRIKMDDRIIKEKTMGNMPLADLSYSVGELVDTHTKIFTDESSGLSGKCYWPTWLPEIPNQVTNKLEDFYQNQLLTVTNTEVSNRIRLAALSIDEWLKNQQNDDLYIELESLVCQIESLMSPLFLSTSFSISPLNRLPNHFNANEEIDTGRLAQLLLKLKDIAASLEDC